MHKTSQELLLNGKIPRQGGKVNWTVLPQGFKNSPTIFGNQVAKELEDWKRQEPVGAILQYVDDILASARTRDDCIQFTVNLLNFLGLSGYRVSKAQIAQEAVAYVGLKIFHGH